jgi:hypothetical protein
MKMNLITVTTRHMLVNTSMKDPNLQPTVESKTCHSVDVVLVKKGKYVNVSFFFHIYIYIYSIFYSLYY